MEEKKWLYIALLVVGFLITIAGIFLSLVSVSIIPRDEGPRATALVGGGDAEVGGVTLHLGEYTIVAGDPQYAGTGIGQVQAACKNDHISSDKGKSTENLLPITIEPTGTFKCLAEGMKFEADSGRLIVQVDEIGLIQAKPAHPSTNPFLPLSKVDAQVQKTALEIWAEVGVVLLFAAGPALFVGALFPLLPLRNRKTGQSLSESSTVNANHLPRHAMQNGRNVTLKTTDRLDPQ